MASIPLVPNPQYKSLTGDACCFCGDTKNQRADTRRHALAACPCRQPLWYKARPSSKDMLLHPATSPAGVSSSVRLSVCVLHCWCVRIDTRRQASAKQQGMLFT